MYHPTTRVLTILELLQSRGRMGGPELAARLEVDLRTVRRYIAMLQDMGIPVETTRGPGGGYRLRSGFKLPPLMFTDDEALAITFSLMRARRQGGLADVPALEGALAKIERVLPEGLRSRIQAVQSSVAFVSEPPTGQPSNERVLLFSTAVQQQRRVKVRYRSGREDTERSLDPYGVVLHWEFWYVVGWCHLRRAVRVFRLDRVLETDLEDVHFEPPSGFNSLEYVLDSLAKAPNGWLVEVLLETALEDAKQLIPPGVAMLEEAKGGVLLRSHVKRLEWLARLMLTWERPFTIRHPQELREALRTVAAEAYALAEAGTQKLVETR
jgi:predicted DNA-binding transcriptional regulator YafY